MFRILMFYPFIMSCHLFWPEATELSGRSIDSSLLSLHQEEERRGRNKTRNMLRQRYSRVMFQFLLTILIMSGGGESARGWEKPGCHRIGMYQQI